MNSNIFLGLAHIDSEIKKETCCTEGGVFLRNECKMALVGFSDVIFRILGRTLIIDRRCRTQVGFPPIHMFLNPCLYLPTK